MKQAILSLEEFQKIIQELEQCREDKKKLLKAIQFLNEQIEEYNREFVDEKQREDNL
jgi:hypothetical protein